MYSNIGKKIMALAVIIVVIMMVASFGFGIYLLTDGQSAVGALAMVFGPIASWVSGFFLYGFGRLVDNSDYVARKMGRRDGYGIPDVTDKLDWSAPDDDEAPEELPSPPKFIAQRVVAADTPSRGSLFCSACGAQIDTESDFCQKCGSKLK